MQNNNISVDKWYNILYNMTFQGEPSKTDKTAISSLTNIKNNSKNVTQFCEKYRDEIKKLLENYGSNPRKHPFLYPKYVQEQLKHFNGACAMVSERINNHNQYNNNPYNRAPNNPADQERVNKFNAVQQLSSTVYFAETELLKKYTIGYYSNNDNNLIMKINFNNPVDNNIFNHTPNNTKEGLCILDYTIKAKLNIKHNLTFRINQSKTTYVCVENDTISEIKQIINDYNCLPCAINMANAYSPGGGVIHGSVAQEEDLCRATNYYPALSYAQSKSGNHGYTAYTAKHIVDNSNGHIINILGDSGVLYSPNVIIFGDKTKGEKDYTSAFVAVAAFNLKEDAGNRKRDRGACGLIPNEKPNFNDYEKLSNQYSNYYRKTYQKIRTMLYAMKVNGHTHLVLGALGSGAFANPPQLIAKMYYDLLTGEFANAFVYVSFAIFVSKDIKNNTRDTINYDTYMNLCDVLTKGLGVEQLMINADYDVIKDYYTTL